LIVQWSERVVGVSREGGNKKARIVETDVCCDSDDVSYVEVGAADASGFHGGEVLLQHAELGARALLVSIAQCGRQVALIPDAPLIPLLRER
jgi:hypothetical protein